MSIKKMKLGNNSGNKICELCHECRILEVHHIRGKDIPNCNHMSNLTNICTECHTKVHLGKIIIEGKKLTSNGYELIWHYNNEESLTNDDASPHLI